MKGSCAYRSEAIFGPGQYSVKLLKYYKRIKSRDCKALPPPLPRVRTWSHAIQRPKREDMALKMFFPILRKVNAMKNIILRGITYMYMFPNILYSE